MFGNDLIKAGRGWKVEVTTNGNLGEVSVLSRLAVGLRLVVLVLPSDFKLDLRMFIASFQ